MTEKIKNYLGIAIMVALVAVAYSSISYVRSYSKSFEPSSFRSFNVTGEGKVVVVPDVATFTFSVISQGERNVGDLQKENSDKVNKAIAFVKSKGVDSKDIKTQNYNLDPQYESFNCNPSPMGGAVSCPPPQIAGYIVSQTVLVKVRDFTKISDLLGGVVLNGANSVSQLNFTVDDRAKVETEAREIAIKQAKEKAKAVARAGGFGVGRLLSIDEGYYPVPYYAEGRGGGTDQKTQALPASAPVIEPGSQEVIIIINLRYEIE